MLKAPASGSGVRLKGANGIFAGGYTDAEVQLLVAGREVQEVGAVLERDIRCPHLPRGPWHLRHVQRYGTHAHRAADAVHTQHAIVAHSVLAAQVVVTDVGRNVVRGIHVNLAAEDVRGRVCSVNLTCQRLRQVNACRLGAFGLSTCRAVAEIAIAKHAAIHFMPLPAP